MGFYSDAKERWKKFYQSPCGKGCLKHGVTGAAVVGLVAFLVRGTTKSVLYTIPAFAVVTNTSLIYCEYQTRKANQKLLSQGRFIESLPKYVRKTKKQNAEGNESKET
ncbi:uncharacterized protein LOC106164232 [Lingula anatina]|uniref:Cytochrome c oxidase assembly protein COX20, mitochondrial n=1 Tax=Lingula anatina TaxID=7574 RepID=A0A1S3IJ55_LINAN|nr:uncharacterized protein LOC106164232 [Lingula anatina]|eukprot:XP_013397534.1 uncharacterized protein LOC106164232 [Lingula anatina]